MRRMIPWKWRRFRSVPVRRLAPLKAERLEDRTVPVILPMGPEFQVNTTPGQSVADPAVSLDAAGNFVVAWQCDGPDGSNNGVFGQRYLADGTPSGAEFRVNTFTLGSQQAPAVARAPGGEFIVVWGDASQHDGSREGVFAQRYSAAGTPAGVEFQVNTFTLNVQGRATVAMDADGDAVVTWESYYQDGSLGGIYAQRFDAAGTPIGDEFRVNSTIAGQQRQPAIGMDPAGDFVITWHSFDGNDYGVYAQRYSAAGTPVGGEFQVNEYTTGAQMNPTAAIDAAGNIIVTWQSDTQDAGTTGVYGRRFDPTGAKLGGEFRVNSFAPAGQTTPVVFADGTGESVILWTSADQDGDAGGVFGQRYAPTGLPIDGEFRVNATTAGSQVAPAVGANAKGDFVGAWVSTGVSGSEIRAQRFSKPPVPTVVVQIDDGSGQRSTIRTITLTFNTEVTFAPGAVALTGANGNTLLAMDTSESTPTQTIARLSFSGPNVLGLGLIDGDYTFALNSAKITNLIGDTLDGDNDSLPGGNSVTAFHRYFGDYDGDRDVDGADFIGMRATFGLGAGNPGFLYYFDFNGDGFVDAFDFLQFRIRFGSQI